MSSKKKAKRSHMQGKITKYQNKVLNRSGNLKRIVSKYEMPSAVKEATSNKK